MIRGAGIGGLCAAAVIVAAASGGCAPQGVRRVAATGSPSPVVSSSATPSPSPTPAATTAAPAPTRSAVPAETATAASQTTGGEVLLLGGAVVLPDRSRTPGATYAEVTQQNIHSTICRTGFTKTIRPDSSYTTGLKEQQLASSYTYQGDTDTSDYEEDHLVPLEVGGAPSDPRNLWPEPYAAADGARKKDLVENKLHDLVCSGALSLATAQQAIATNWWDAYQRYGGEGSPEVWDGTYAGADSTSGSTSGSSSGSTSSDPAGATAQCKDGTYSYSQHRSGTCSHHGGVARWINEPPS